MRFLLLKFEILTSVIHFVSVQELSEEEKQMIILSGEFQRFLDRAGRLMERAVSESVDIYTDYTGVADSDEGA
jgi:dynein intermediate chain